MRKLRQQQLPIQREERSILYKSSMKQIFCYKAYCHLLMLLKALPALILYFFSPWPSLHEDWFISLWNSLHFLLHLHLLTVICGIHLVYHFYNRMEEMEKRLSFCHDQHISYNMHMFTHTHMQTIKHPQWHESATKCKCHSVQEFRVSVRSSCTLSTVSHPLQAQAAKLSWYTGQSSGIPHHSPDVLRCCT